MAETLSSFLYDAKQQRGESNDQEKEYGRVLTAARDYISRNYSEQLALTLTEESSGDQLKRIIEEFISLHHLYVEGIDMNALVEKIYKDMAGLGFLEEFIHDPDVEEINAFAWNNIEIVTAGGRYRLRDKGFTSPLAAEDTVKKMIRCGGLTLDVTTPVVDSYLTEGVRVSAMIPPVTDAKKGVAFSIRKQNKAKITKGELLSADTATEDMLDFFALCINHGVSMSISGKTGSGKTTDISYILNQAEKTMRIFTIEETRELYIERADEGGRPTDNVIHTCTRPNDIESANITYDDLLRASLRYHPDILALAEMRGAEAMTVVESARTGHTVITSLHANNAVSSYNRILSMCQMSETTIPTDVLLLFVAEAFPVVIFAKQMPDRSRKITEVIEAVGVTNNRIETRTLWSYDLDEQRHKRVNPISKQLATLLREHDAELREISRFTS